MKWDQYFTTSTLSSAYCIVGDVDYYLDDMYQHLVTMYPDYTKELLRYGTMKIDDATALRQDHTERGKTLLILVLDFATHETQNALLKFIEEPPRVTHIIVCVPHYTTLLDTLYSRCVMIDLRATTHDATKNLDTLSSPQEFLSLSYTDRLLLIKKLTKKAVSSDDENSEDSEGNDDENNEEEKEEEEEAVSKKIVKKKSGKEKEEVPRVKKITHSDVQQFIQALEKYLYTHKKVLVSQVPYVRVHETLALVKGYVASPSSSLSMLLEMIALVLPVV